MEFKEITWDNLRNVLGIRVNENQKKFIPDVSVFLAQAYVNLKSGYLDSCFGIYDNDVVVGFTKIVYVPPHEEVYNFAEPTYMIDFSFSGECQKNNIYKKHLN